MRVVAIFVQNLNISQKVYFSHKNDGAYTQEMNINHISFCLFFSFEIAPISLFYRIPMQKQTDYTHIYILVCSENEFYNAFNCQL